MKPRFIDRLVAALGLTALLAVSSHGADRTRNTTSTGLINSGAWVGGTAPNSADRAIWNSSSSGGAQTLGGNASWGGILVSSGVASSLNFSNAANPSAFTLTLGSIGLNLNNGGITNRGVTFESNISLELGANQTWQLGRGGSGANVIVNSVISGTGSLEVTRDETAANYLLFAGANTFSGGLSLGSNTRLLLGSSSLVSGSSIASGPIGTGSLTINGGTISSSSSFGRDIAATSISLGGNLVIGEATTYTGRVRVNGAFDLGNATRIITMTNGTATGGSGNARFGFVTIAGSTIANSVSNGTLSLQSLAGSGSTSYVNFASQVDFQGNAGLILGNRVSTSIGTNSAFGGNAADRIPNLTLQTGSQLDMSDQSTGVRSFSIASLSGSGSITSNASVTGTSILTINGAGASATDGTSFSGLIIDGANVTLALVKSGDTTQTLTGASTYSGGTTISGGLLKVNNSSGSATGSGAVTLLSNGALGGSGIIAGPLDATGSLQPGNSIGTITVGSDVTWNASTPWIFELGTASLSLAAASSGSDNDLLNITGTGSDFLRGTGTLWSFDFANTGAVGWYKLVDWSGSSTFSAGDFAASNLGAGLSGTFSIDSGSSALYLNVVPEPTIALLGSLGVLFILRRRR